MKLGLSAKLIFSILTPAVAGLVLIAGANYKMSNETLRQQITADMIEIVQAQSIGIHSTITGLQSSLKVMSVNQRLMTYISAYKNPSDKDFLHSSEALIADKALADFINSSDFILYSGLLGTDGTVLANHIRGQNGPSKSVGADFSSRQYFKECMTGKDSITEIISATTGLPTTILASPVMQNGKILGVLTIGVDNAKLAASITGRIKVGKKGFAFIYSKSGKLVIHPDAKSIGRDDSKLPHVAEMLQKKDGLIRYDNAQGEGKTVFFKTLPEEGWLICLELDREELLAPVQKMLTNSSLLAGACVLLVGIIIVLSSQSIVRLVRGFAGIARAVAGGRLEHTPAESALLQRAQKRGDEFSVLGDGMEEMQGNIKRLLDESELKTQSALEATEQARQATARAEEAARQAESAKREGMLAAAGQLEKVVEIITSTSHELSDRIKQSDSIAASSSQRLSAAATAMNEMNTTVQEVARNASSASAVSSETRANAESGAQIVESALQSIEQVHTVSLALKDDMAQLNEHAQAITHIMGVISDIADQTNLLALNAAIEAARAGEAGRGFAVVADEVRKLAEKTMASTGDVQNAITAIQGSAAQSVAAMDKALTEVETASGFAGKSGEALRQILGNVEATADQVRAIATASEEQSAASDEINQSIVEVNEMSVQTAQAMTEAAGAIAELAQQAQGLSQLIAGMKQG